MENTITRDKILEEVKRIPERKLAGLFALIREYRLGLEPEDHKPARKYAGCWKDMPDEVYHDFVDEIAQRRSQAFSRRRDREANLD